MNARMPTSSNATARIEPQAEGAVTGHMAPARQPRAARSEVRLSIDRLHIEGLSMTSRQGAHLQGTIERELARLLQTQPLQLSGGAIDGLRTPSLSSITDLDPDALGVEIAHKLFAALRTTGQGE